MLILLLLVFISYILWVPNGKWGTLSDVIIATFTFIIAYTTTLLLVAAYIAGNSWFDQFKYQKENEFIETLVSIFILNQIIREYNNRLSMYQDLIHKEEGDDETFARRWHSERIRSSCEGEGRDIERLEERSCKNGEGHSQQAQ